MSILRKHLSSGFTTIPNETLRDPRLSFKATGILAVLLSHTDGWNISSEEMAKDKPDGVTAIRTGYDELCKAGYMRRVKVRNNDGTYSTFIDISDVSLEEWISDEGKVIDLTVENPTKDQPRLENLTLDNLSPNRRTEEENQNRKPSTDKTNSRTSEIEVPHEPTEIVPAPSSGQPSLSVVKGETGTENDVFEAWVEATGRDSRRTKFTPDRKSKVRARLRDGYTVEELVQAVRGVMLSSWHTGDNPDGKTYTELNFIMRNGTNVERFRDLYLSGGDKKPEGQMTRVMKLLDGSGAFGGRQRELHG